eukprot:Amastigsp_a174925_7200.p4 type:complete len:104 gc:universal Amastigsp_a174925_7200:325-14(-)
MRGSTLCACSRPSKRSLRATATSSRMKNWARSSRSRATSVAASLISSSTRGSARLQTSRSTASSCAPWAPFGVLCGSCARPGAAMASGVAGRSTVALLDSGLE